MQQILDNLDTGLEFRTKSNENFTEVYTAIANAPYKTVKLTIGGVGVEDVDFNFVTAENQVEQVIDLGAIIPELARIVDVFAITNDEFTGAVSLGIEVGTTTGTNNLIASADLSGIGALTQIATGSLPKVDISSSVSKIFVSGTPGANWSLVTAGKLTIYISYIDVTNV